VQKGLNFEVLGHNNWSWNSASTSIQSTVAELVPVAMLILRELVCTRCVDKLFCCCSFRQNGGRRWSEETIYSDQVDVC